ncbi:prolyl oligopeptidase family serine peptidase [Streptomyces cyaneofuscatus]
MSADRPEVPYLTVEDILDSPDRTGAVISPDGSKFAYLAPWRNRLNVWIQDLDGEAEARCVTADSRRSVLRYHWTDDPRWLLYEQDGGGDENYHLHRVDLGNPDADAVDLTPFPGALVTGFDLPPTRPGHAVLNLNHRDPAVFDLYELHIATGELTLLAQNPGGSSALVYAPDGTMYGHGLSEGGDIELSRWEPESGTMCRVTTFPGSDHPLDLQPFQLTPDGTGAWVGSYRDSEHTRIVHVDLNTGQETVVDSHPGLDVDPRAAVFPALPAPLILDRRTKDLIGVRYLGERAVIRPLTAHFADVLDNLRQLSDGDVAALSSDREGQRWIVSFTHDRDPGVTHFYDHTTGDSRVLFRPYPHLDPAALAPMTPVTIRARDGLELPSYLTLPLHREAAALPMVLQVHGGPWHRDSWGFDPTAQLLANRGYAVLQVNYRGSTGFGKSFLKAGIGELSGAMHDDLVDAVGWAVEQGYADPSRVAVFGGSYGGYAALVGVSFTPGLFAAAVDFCGPSNLVTTLRNMPDFAKPYLTNNWHLYAGDPEDPAQEADLWARSPLSRVAEIRTPLLVVQGANDARVLKSESDQIVEALRNRGIDVEYLVKEDEGHSFVNPENNIAMYHAADHFLARHLRGDGSVAAGSST